MKRKINILAGDTALWVIFILMSVISLVAVYSTIGFTAINDYHTTPRSMFIRHLEFVAGSFFVIILLSRVNYRFYSKLSLYGYIISLILVIIVAIMQTRWIRVPGLFSFQPSELAKIMLMIFLARNIAINRERLDESSTFWILLATIVLVCAFVVGENLSTALLMFVASYILLFFGNVNRNMWWRGFFIFLALGVVAFAIIYFFGDKMDLFRSTTWGHRLQAWLHPNPEELNQENMARMAVARGGFTGNGIGTTIHGRLMTQAHNDFIYSIIIEEVGMLGAIVIFLLYALFYFRCIRIAHACKGLFGSLSVAGIGTVIFLQALINMSVAVGVLPVTGQTLPFISYGGSSYLFLAGGVAVIQSVAIDNKKQRQQAQQQTTPIAVSPEESTLPNNDMLNPENEKI